MLFGSSKRLKDLPDFDINPNGVSLKKVSSYKYLGVTLDSQLNYEKHIQQTISSASGKLAQFRRMRGFLNEKAALLVYKNMLLPVIEYRDILLTGATTVRRKKLQTLQNKGLRCALRKDRFTSSSELHRDAKC